MASSPAEDSFELEFSAVKSILSLKHPTKPCVRFRTTFFTDTDLGQISLFQSGPSPKVKPDAPRITGLTSLSYGHELTDM